MKFIQISIMAWIIFHSMLAKTEAYIPSSDSQILERLPVATAERQELRQLRSQLNANPGIYPAAYNLAKKYIALGRTQSDPRYYGYAEAVLEPWLKQPDSKPDAMVLHATILQNRHDFHAALAVLNNAVNINPKLPQAWLTLAAIYEVQGDYPSALRSCMALARYTSGLSTTACTYSALSLSGQAESSYRQLISFAKEDGDPEELSWFYTLLAEMAERLNLSDDAEKWYQKAINQNYRSVYLLTGYADYLLDRNRPDEVINLLHDEIKSDALLLRLVLAEQKTGSNSFAEHVGFIKDRIAAAKARGDTAHQGDEARFYLHVINDPETALDLAIKNWVVQKEPRDARILLEAAMAAKNIDAAAPVIEFLAQRHLEDNRLNHLLKSSQG